MSTPEQAADRPSDGPTSAPPPHRHEHEEEDAMSSSQPNVFGHLATCEEASHTEDMSQCGQPAAFIVGTGVGSVFALCGECRRLARALHYRHARRRGLPLEYPVEYPVEGIPLGLIAYRQAPPGSPAHIVARAVRKAKAEYDRLRRDEVPLDECWAEVEALAELLSPSRELVEAS